MNITFSTQYIGMLLFALWSAFVASPSAAQSVDSAGLSELAKHASGIDMIQVVDGLDLHVFDAFIEMESKQVHIPIAVVNKADGVPVDFYSVLLFNATGEPYELKKSAVYGEHSPGKKIRIEVWSTELIADAKGSSLYVYWSREGKSGVARVPFQSKGISDVDEMLTASEDLDTNENSDNLLALVRSWGNLRLSSRGHDITKVLLNSTSKTSMEACIVALAKLGLSDTEYQSILGEPHLARHEGVADHVGKLRQVFQRGVAADKLLAVKNVDNTEARRWVILRLAYLGRKDLIQDIPVEMAWHELMRFRLMASALADARRDKNE